MSTTNLGKVTAYAYAVAGGYTGTEAEFEAILGNIASGHGSIANIEKTGTAGSVDTYTITFTDGTTATFDITNGEVTEAQLETILEAYAKTDGYYESMTVGNAEQLNSSVGIVDKEPYNYRTAGGSVEIGNRAYSKWVGGSLAVNQLVPITALSTTAVTNNGDGSFTVASGADNYYTFTDTFSPVIGHKYLVLLQGGIDSTLYVRIETTTGNALSTKANYIVDVSGTMKPYIYLHYRNIEQNTKVVPQVFDLTQMFGTTIADYIYSLETATPGAGVAWFRKYFPYDYYAYQAPTLEHVTISEYQTTELNQWDEVWEVGIISSSTGQNVSDSEHIRSKNYCRCLPDTTYYANISGSYFIRLYWYDEDKNFINAPTAQRAGTITTPSNAYYFKLVTWDAPYGTTYKNDICINLHWDGEMDGVYQPYKLHSYPLDDSIVLRGVPKKDDSGKLYFDGDTWEAGGTVTRKYGVVDLGTLNWTQFVSDGKNCFLSDVISDAGIAGANIIPNIKTSKYTTVTASPSQALLILKGDNVITTNTLNKIFIWDTTNYANPTAFKTAMNGVYLVYELATPTTEQGPEFNEPQVVDNFGTEALLGSSIPVGHETNYTANLRAKIETAPDSPDGDGDYIMRQTSGANAYVELGSTTTIQNIISRLEALEAE